MARDSSKIHSALERKIIRDAARNFRDSIALRKTPWRTRLLKIEMAAGQFVAWYATKLLGWREGDLEPQAIEEWDDETGDFTNRRPS
jgi:hypothetical protein